MVIYFAAIGTFTIGILVRAITPVPQAMLIFLALGAMGFAILVWLMPRTIYLRVLILIGALLLGIVRMQIAPHSIPPNFSSLLGTHARLEGRVVADPDVRELNQRITLEVVSGKMHTRMIAVAPLYPVVVFGERLQVTGSVEAPTAFDTDGGRSFDYPNFLAKDGVFALIKNATIKVLAPPLGFITVAQEYLYEANHRFAQAMQHALPTPESGLAIGIMVGGKQGLGKPLLEAFTAAGMLQIVVLSGYNVMIVAEAVMRVFSFFSRRVAISVAAASISMFIVAAGSGSSAVRAGIMAYLALFARFTGRDYDAQRALWFVLLLIGLWNPLTIAFDPGFQLSWLATLGLMLASPFFERRLLFITYGAVREAFATTIAAESFVLPLLLWQTGNFSIVSIPANAIASFFVPVAMGLSFVAGLVAIACPALANGAGIPAYMALHGIIFIARFAASLPFARIGIPTFGFVWVVMAYASLLLLLRWEHKRTAGDLSPAVLHTLDAKSKQLLSDSAPRKHSS